MFDATLQSLHDCTSRWHLSCYAVHVFSTCLYIPLTSFMLRCICLLYMIVHPLTSFLLRCICILYMIVHPLTSFLLRCICILYILYIPLTSVMLRCTCLLYMIVHLRCMLEAWNVAAANEKGKNTEFATGGGALLLVESQFLRTCP